MRDIARYIRFRVFEYSICTETLIREFFYEFFLDWDEFVFNVGVKMYRCAGYAFTGLKSEYHACEFSIMQNKPC